MKTPTHREIAKACGVSSSTVSRAVNRHPSIPEATRTHILSVARGLGWQPNPLASAYMSHLRSTRPPSFQALIGAILDYPMPNHSLDDLPSHIRFRYQGFERRVAEYGFKVEAFSLGDHRFASAAKLDRILSSRNVPGFVITGLSRPREVLQGLNFSRYAILTVGYSVSAPPVHRVALNTSQGFKLVIDRAFALGYRRLAVAASKDYDKRTNNGLLMPACHAKLNLRRGTALEILKVDEPGDREVETIARWLKRVRPEFALGPGVHEAIQLLGWRVPHDIAFATFDRSPGFPDHAGLDQRHEMLGRLAADALVSEIIHNRRGIPDDPVEHLLQGQWIDGASAPPRIAAATESLEGVGLEPVG